MYIYVCLYTHLCTFLIYIYVHIFEKGKMYSASDIILFSRNEHALCLVNIFLLGGNFRTGEFWNLTLMQQNKCTNRLSKHLIVHLPSWLPPFVCIATSCVQTRISSPVSLCSAGFPSSWLGKRGLIQTASGGVNFLQSHFVLFIAAMPGVQADCVEGGSRNSPLP